MLRFAFPLFALLLGADPVLAIKPAPPAEVLDLSIATVDGKTFTLAERRGRWVVVNYWATWCGPCIKEMPDLDALDRTRDDVDVVGLAFEDTSLEDLQDFLKQHPVGYPIALIDTYAPPATFAVPKGLPTTHVIGPDGRLAKSYLGPVTRADIERLITGAEVASKVAK